MVQKDERKHSSNDHGYLKNFGFINKKTFNFKKQKSVIIEVWDRLSLPVTVRKTSVEFVFVCSFMIENEYIPSSDKLSRQGFHHMVSRTELFKIKRHVLSLTQCNLENYEVPSAEFSAMHRIWKSRTDYWLCDMFWSYHYNRN